ncbi:MAG TPA: hypothetical protein VGM88_31045 [Kofleriaceae bacterium]|jgi:hypothetical protein
MACRSFALRRALPLLLLAGCLSVPAYHADDQVEPDAPPGDGGGGGDAGGSGVVMISVVSRDGFATTVPNARVIVRDESSQTDGDVQFTDARGELMVSIAHRSTIFVATPSAAESPQLVAIEGVEAGDTLEIGAALTTPTPIGQIMGGLGAAASTSDEVYLYTPCGYGELAASTDISPVVTVAIDSRCAGRTSVPALVWDESNANDVRQWSAGSFSPSNFSITLASPTAGAPLTLTYAAGAQPVSEIIGGVRAIIFGEHVGLLPIDAVDHASIFVGSPGNTIEVESYVTYDDSTIGVTAIRERVTFAGTYTVNLAEASLPPYVDNAPMVDLTGALSWQEDAAEGQVEPTLVVADFATTAGGVRWIAPAGARFASSATPQLSLAPPGPFASFTVADAFASSVQLVLLDGATYATARGVADPSTSIGIEPDFGALGDRMVITGLSGVPEVVP